MKSIQVQHIEKMIKDNQLEYIIDKAIGDNDFNKISLIFTVATNQIYDYGLSENIFIMFMIIRNK